MIRQILAFLACGFLTINIYSQALNFTKLDSLFYKIELSNKFMGRIAVSIDGRIIYNKGIGFSDIEENLVVSQFDFKYK